jgi:hypothetical protein
MIDPDDEQREFFFSLFVTSADTYQIEECGPKLPSDRVAPLIADLNKNNRFSTFVQQMRKLFKEQFSN